MEGLSRRHGCRSEHSAEDAENVIEQLFLGRSGVEAGQNLNDFWFVLVGRVSNVHGIVTIQNISDHVKERSIALFCVLDLSTQRLSAASVAAVASPCIRSVTSP